MLQEKGPVENWEIPENVDIPRNIERKEGVTPIPTRFSSSVVDDQGKPLVSTPQDKNAITIPINDKEISIYKGGKASDSSTWFGYFWDRIKKKLFFSKANK